MRLSRQFTSMLAKRNSELTLRESCASPSPYGVDSAASPLTGGPAQPEAPGRYASSALSRFNDPVDKPEADPEIFAQAYDLQHTYLQ